MTKLKIARNVFDGNVVYIRNNKLYNAKLPKYAKGVYIAARTEQNVYMDMYGRTKATTRYFPEGIYLSGPVKANLDRRLDGKT